jgi:DNA-binding transcriptional MocR family regulator
MEDPLKNLEVRLAERARGREPSPIRELQKYMRIEGMISLGGGYPNPGTFVFDRIDVAFRDGTSAGLSGAELTTASQYGASDSHAGLRDEILSWHREKDGVTLDQSRLVVLNGSQEGLLIAAYLLVDRDDCVAVSEPTYPGALSAFRSFTRNFVSAPLDANGVDTAALAETLEARESLGERAPKFIYVIPNGHNPGGVALSLERREHLLEIAERFDTLILEDDPYQLVRLDPGPPPTTIQSMDTGGRVIRLDSFSKIFAPGLRIGYASGPTEMMREFVLFKQSSNLHTSTFIQALLCAYMRTAGHDAFRRHIERNCEFYRRNRDVMIEAAREHLPADVRYNVPGEGMFVWFVLPEDVDAGRLVERYSTDLKVLLVPGGAFSTRGGLSNCMRASFSMVSPDDIREGMKRFGEMVRKGRAGNE